MMLALPAPQAQAAPAPPAPVPVKALYGWGYEGPEGEGTGLLSLFLDPATGRVVMEIQGLGERLLLLEGDRAAGYRVQVPRQKLDARAATLAGLPLPFLPQIPSPGALLALLRQGAGPGVTIQKQDALGPVKLHWTGKDPQGRTEQVWLTRKRWQPLAAAGTQASE